MMAAPKDTIRRRWGALLALGVVAALLAAGWMVAAYTPERYGIRFVNRTEQNLTVEWTLKDLEGRQLQRSFSFGPGETHLDPFVTTIPGNYILEVSAGPRLNATEAVRFAGSCDPSVFIRFGVVDIRPCSF